MFLLPQPALASEPRTLPRLSRFQRRVKVSNLTFGLLILALVLSLAANYHQSTRFHRLQAPLPSTLRAASVALRSDAVKSATNLIVVAGHGIWRGCNTSEWTDERNWVLQQHQKGTDNPRAFYSHIKKGVALASRDPASILLFSGGYTRPELPTQSEAESYLALALQSFDYEASWRARAFTEDYALDSFQNLFFSIMRFHELAIAVGKTGRASWPMRIAVVGFEMKRRRFVELHRHALRWPNDSFDYIGLDLLDPTERDKGWQGEETYGFGPYTRDLYGCHGLLAEKRMSRNPAARFFPYKTTSPELAALIDWCPSETASQQLFTGPLPWD
ncbi:SubName: Full=Uncharacterized protein {ECO:0000313/EMBL:CCA70951.1} [Serendipita indica DSM 11827]|nr:SubName: Full=Uncharacterized protein {ECO:0000313/EMBL:CCA70951.1} [Serendipita indica DSM 11827]